MKGNVSKNFLFYFKTDWAIQVVYYAKKSNKIMAYNIKTELIE